MSERPRIGRSDVIDAAVVFALTMMAVFAFRSSYGGVDFLVVAGIAALVGIGVALAGVAFRFPLIVTLAIATAVYVTLGPILALAHYTASGFVPTPTSMREALTSAVTGWKELVTTAPPVGSTGDLMILPVVVAMLSACGGLLLAHRFRYAAPAVVLPFVVLGLGIATGTKDPVSVIAHGAVFVAVVIAWLAWREQQRRPLLEGAGTHVRQVVAGTAVLSLAAVGGFLFAPSMPGAEASGRDIWRQTVVPPFDPRQYPSPLNGYRDFVKMDVLEDGTRAEPEVMFTVEGLPEGLPIRMATMDSWDGLVWQVSGGDRENPSLRDSGSFERIGARLDPDVDGEIAEVAITIAAYKDVWIPDVGEVLELRFTGSADGPERDRALNNSFRYNRATDTAATVIRLQRGDRYEMTVRLPVVLDEMTGQVLDPDIQRIGQARAIDEIPQVLATPDLLVISETTVRLDRVRDLMVNTGAYSDGDIDAGHIRARAGHSAARLTNFVAGFPRRPFVGNAEQYASTYALLFRQLDSLPTRVVMGFLPSAGSVSGPVEVLSTEADAWVEVPIQDVGWVGIYPTPSRDQLSSTTSAPQQPEPDYRTQNPPPPPLLDPEFDQPAKASGDAKAPDDPDETADQSFDDQSEANEPIISGRTVKWAGIAASPLIIFGLLAFVVIGLKVIRRRRRQRRGRPDQRIANGWREVTDLAVDLGRPVPDATTRREAANFVGSETLALAHRTDTAVWGGDYLTDEQVDAYWAQLRSTLDAMKSEVGPLDRLKAAVSWQSLRRRPKAART